MLFKRTSCGCPAMSTPLQQPPWSTQTQTASTRMACQVVQLDSCTNLQNSDMHVTACCQQTDESFCEGQLMLPSSTPTAVCRWAPTASATKLHPMQSALYSAAWPRPPCNAGVAPRHASCSTRLLIMQTQMLPLLILMAVHFFLPTVMSQLLCSSQSKGAQRAATRSQLNVGLPSRLLTALCVRHIHREKSRPLFTTGGSRLRWRASDTNTQS